MSHLKMDKFGRVSEIGFDGEMGIDDVNKMRVLAAYRQPGLRESAMNMDIESQKNIVPVKATSTTASQTKTSSVKPITGVGNWLKSIFVIPENGIKQSSLNVKATDVITTAPVEHTVVIEKPTTPTQEVAPEGQTVLEPVVVEKLTELSRAAQVKALATARKEGKTTGKLTDEEKSFMSRHPFLDIIPKAK